MPDINGFRFRFLSTNELVEAQARDSHFRGPFHARLLTGEEFWVHSYERWIRSANWWHAEWLRTGDPFAVTRVAHALARAGAAIRIIRAEQYPSPQGD